MNFDQKKLLARFWRSASCFWREDRPRAAVLIVFLVGIVLLQLLVQVLLNLWNRHFFDALERRDGQALWFQAGMFFSTRGSKHSAGGHVGVGPMRAQRSWREAATTLRFFYVLETSPMAKTAANGLCAMVRSKRKPAGQRLTDFVKSNGGVNESASRYVRNS